MKCKGPGCKNETKRSNQKYCCAKCKKNYENSLRSARKESSGTAVAVIQSGINRPHWLNATAASYWDKVAPTVIERGHLNILSEDAFAELCDIYSRLVEVNRAIDETNRSLLQVVDVWNNKSGTEEQQLKESALSDLKRKYSKLFLDYQKQFYLTPGSNRGDFGLENRDKEEKGGASRFFE